MTTLNPPGADPEGSGRQESSPAGRTPGIQADNAVGVVDASGSARVFIKQISYHTPLSEAAEERELQKAELESLRQAIEQKYDELSRLAAAASPVRGNPYLFLQPFQVTDHARFFGREDLLAAALERLERQPVTFLDGNPGAGKTSLLRAGLVPGLIDQGHLPLLVNVTGEQLAYSIKRQLLPDVAGMKLMSRMALTEFLRLVAEALPDGKKLFLLVDDFEDYFEQGGNPQERARAEMERRSFYQEWQACFSSAPLNVHWLFCVPSDKRYTLSFFEKEVWPNELTVSVYPFRRETARDAMLRPAESLGIHIGNEVSTSILDTLGGDHIDPAALQVVCYCLAGGNGPLVREWDMEYYMSQQGAEGILRDYLERCIDGLPGADREPAWEMLSVLAHHTGQPLSEPQLVARLDAYGRQPEVILHVLEELQRRQLVEQEGGYRLANSRLRRRIEQWEQARSIRQRARHEAAEQWQSIRNSALRGLAGGALGFVLADQLLYTGPRVDVSFMIFLILLDIAIGSLTGLALVFSVDVSLASYDGPRRGLAYLAGGLGGMLALGFALVLYTDLNYLGDQALLAVLPWAILEGGLWGLAAGLGTVWVLRSERPAWLTLPVVVMGCGAMLTALDLVMGVLRNTPVITDAWWTIFLAGMLLPGFILVAARLGRKAGSPYL